MHSLKDIQLKCNKQFIVNFDGGELSSDGELLMIKEFFHVLGFENLLKDNFKTNAPASFRIHKDDENLPPRGFGYLDKWKQKLERILHMRYNYMSERLSFRGNFA